ncbi:MAG: MBL fold metallo-hydrolase [Candidatus Zixiibacteriota bacterium]
MPSNSFTILGSSSGMPHPHRACSGYVLKVNDRLSLIDCGGGVCSSFLRQKFDPLVIERIFISHTHPDHICELPLVIQMVYLAGKRDDLDIYVPSEFVQPLKAFLPAVYLIEDKFPFELNIIGYEAGMIFSGEYTLTAFSNRHLKGYAQYIKQPGLPNKMQSHSFLIEVGDKSLIYSSDIADLHDIKKYLNGKDYVVLESTHIDLDEFFAFAQTIKVGWLIITHLGTEEEVANIVQGAQKAGLDNLATAFDGMELSL